jgi:hypothetical protein
MKIERDEFMKWYESGSPEDSFNWFDMDTGLAEHSSDSELLGRIATLAINDRGFGLIAELCKRFNKE